MTGPSSPTSSALRRAREEEGEKGKEKEGEEEAEEDAVVPVQLLFLTSYDSLSLPVSGCRLTSTSS